MTARFAFVEGATSDLAFVACAPTLGELFVAASEALLAASVENPDAVVPRERHALALEEPDLELLLLRFLNQLVFLRDARGLLLRARHVHVSGGPPARLEALLEGERLERGRHLPAADVKAATAHGLRVERRSEGQGPGPREGFRASVTLDV